MAAWSGKTWKKLIFFAFFFGKITPCGKIFKLVFQKGSSAHRSTCCVQISWNLVDGKSVKSCVNYLTKKNKISPGSPALTTVRLCPKSTMASPRKCTQSTPDLQISSKLVHFRRSYIQTHEHRQSMLQSESNIRLKPSFKPNNNDWQHVTCSLGIKETFSKSSFTNQQQNIRRRYTMIRNRLT